MTMNCTASVNIYIAANYYHFTLVSLPPVRQRMQTFTSWSTFILGMSFLKYSKRYMYIIGINDFKQYIGCICQTFQCWHSPLKQSLVIGEYIGTLREILFSFNEAGLMFISRNFSASPFTSTFCAAWSDCTCWNVLAELTCCSPQFFCRSYFCCENVTGPGPSGNPVVIAPALDLRWCQLPALCSRCVCPATGLYFSDNRLPENFTDTIMFLRRHIHYPVHF